MDPADSLEAAGERLRRFVARVRSPVRRASGVTRDAAAPTGSRGVVVRRRRSTHVEQLVAAGASVVWIAGFVQTVFSEIAGDRDAEE
ncbi:MAG: hypothetical protein ACREIT_08670 [Tepidisphaeraceae bacterium]